jgi:hypothetical protein
MPFMLADATPEFDGLQTASWAVANTTGETVTSGMLSDAMVSHPVAVSVTKTE